MKLKPLHWIASSQKDLMRFPEAVRDEAGFALYLAQAGNMALGSVPMVGFGGSKVVEVVIDNRGNTFRAVYTVKFARAVYDLERTRSPGGSHSSEGGGVARAPPQNLSMREPPVTLPRASREAPRDGARHR
jgi:phage-related protein